MSPNLITKSRVRRAQKFKTAAWENLLVNPLNGNIELSDSYDGEYLYGFEAFETLTTMGHRGPPFKEGGPFSLKRYSIQRNTANVSQHGTYHSAPNAIYNESRIRGLRTANYSSLFSLPNTLDDEFLKQQHDLISFPATSLASYGATAINRFSPLNPGASLGQTLVESITGGLPNIPLLKSRCSHIRDNTKFLNRLSKKAGQEYLNGVFGWVPLLTDIRNVYKTWRTLNSKMEQIIRNNGRPIRRKGTLLKEQSVNTVENYFSPQFALPRASFEGVDSITYPDPFGQSQPSMTTKTSEEVWFSGSFRYYIPDVTDDRWSRKAKLALFGLYPSPSLLYEVMPWSWLIDWFSNVGDVISNLSSNGIADLIVDYGYLMRHRKVTQTVSFGTVPTFGFSETLSTTEPIAPSNLSVTITKETMERIAATPFGFGLQLEDLSDRQAAILVALGLSRNNFG